MRVIVFDVNETLLDLAPMSAHFERHFGDAKVAKTWFGQLLQNALVATVTETYRDFVDLARDALEMVAEVQNVHLNSVDKDNILGTMRHLPPHDDVRESLERLKAAGFRLATLTNSPYRSLTDQLTNAGLIDLLEQTLSVDEVKLFKPHRAAYVMAAEKLGVSLSDIRIVAAHNWDTTGAIRAGCKAAFLARPGHVLGEADERPDIIADTMDGIVDQIIQQDKE